MRGACLACAGWLALSSSASAKEETIPFHLVDNRVFVDVRVNGRGPFAFILDTGSSSATVATSLARQLHLAPQGSGTTDGAGENRVNYFTTHLDSLVLGDIDLGPIDAPAIDVADIQRAIGFPRFDGVLGAEVFQHHVVTIDVEHPRLTLEDAASFRPDAHATTLPLTFNDDGDPLVTGAINGIPGRFIIDTGDRSSLTIFGPFWRAHQLDRALGPAVVAMTGFGVGGPIMGIVGRPRSFTFGGVEVPPPVTRLSLQKAGVFANADYAGSIGMGILKRFVVAFDYPGHRMYMTRSSAFDVPDRYDRVGLWLGLGSGNDLEVMDVVTGGPADGAGVAKGDAIEAVGSLSANAENLFSIRDGLTSPVAQTLIVKFQHENQERTVHLRPRSLINEPERGGK